MSNVADVIVIGLGGMGSACCYHLASRGATVIGIDQFSPVHDLGSSHGETRVIRQAYFEHPDYVPLLKRAYTLWDELSQQTGRSLFNRTGVVYFGPRTGTLLEGIRLSARLHSIPIEEMSLMDARRRFPAFSASEGYASIYEPDAGYLAVEDCVRAHLEVAEKNGARFHWGAPVLDWRMEKNSVQVRTATETFTARRLVLTVGAWSPNLATVLGLPLRVLRKVMFWSPVSADSDWARMPCYLYDLPYGVVYGFGGQSGPEAKIAEHSGGAEVADPSRVNRAVQPADAENVVRAIRENIPGLIPAVTRHKVCLYTMTPDQNFILGQHPGMPHVSIAAGFSGHGFKFASVIGEVLADLVQSGQTPHPIGFLRGERFLTGSRK
ncbi:MAG: N-methyl-L-tryptophan oxidase [Bacteriovoracia bacterium]